MSNEHTLEMIKVIAEILNGLNARLDLANDRITEIDRRNELLQKMIVNALQSEGIIRSDV